MFALQEALTEAMKYKPMLNKAMSSVHKSNSLKRQKIINELRKYNASTLDNLPKLVQIGSIVSTGQNSLYFTF